MAFSVFLNVLASSLLPKFEDLIIVLQIVGFPCHYGATYCLWPPTAMLRSVFVTFQNSGQWSPQVLSCFVGIIGNVVAFVGVSLVA